MEKTLHDLADILLKAIPTVIILVILHQFLKFVLFNPIENMLRKRHDLTAGARKSASVSLANAERKTAEYETKLRDAKSVVYKEQEDTRRKWLSDQTDQLAQAKVAATARVAIAKQEIATEASSAKASLERTSDMLADQIATTILTRRNA
jgi:F-type H+-transporting ATPase subunit b